MKNSPTTQQIITACALIALIFSTYVIYRNGLTGSFLFDDESNLSALGASGGIHTFRSAMSFILNGDAGPGGRPIALASFLLNDIDWPSSAAPFIYTNILIHLVNIALLFWLALELTKTLRIDPIQQYLCSFLTAALWGLHPLFTSTVLYVVQRMTLLSASFAMIGLILFIKGQAKIEKKHPLHGYILMSLGVGGGTLFSFLSKENGALTPLLAGMLLFTILRKKPEKNSQNWAYTTWKLIFIYTPSIAIFVFFFVKWSDFAQKAHLRRNYTLVERLLTETRVIWDYIAQIAIPKIQSSGLYYDNYTISHSLTSPVSTAYAAAGLLLIIAIAIAVRKRFPIASAGVLFFFGGHLIESTIVPLEIYFEHRNYLPTILLFFALAYGLSTAFRYRPISITGLSTVMLCTLAILSASRTSLWGNPILMGQVWAKENPDSVRAQQQAARSFWNIGRPDLSAKQLQKGITRNPDSKVLQLQLVAAQCAANADNPAKNNERISKKLRTGGLSGKTIDVLHLLNNYIIDDACTTLSPETVSTWINSALQNKASKWERDFAQRLYYEKGRLLSHQNRAQLAEQAFNDALSANPNVTSALQMVAVLATDGHHVAALHILNKAETIHDEAKKSDSFLPMRTTDYESEIKRLRKNINNHIKNAHQPGKGKNDRQ